MASILQGLMVSTSILKHPAGLLAIPGVFLWSGFIGGIEGVFTAKRQKYNALTFFFVLKL